MASNSLTDVMQASAAAQYPSEACGVVIRKGKKSIALPCKNLAENPRAHFVMDIHDYAAAADQGEIIGIWHTHVEMSNSPSDADRVGCENSELPWYIISIHKAGDSFVFSDAYVLNPSGFEMPYLERPYAFGVLDCWSLVRDYYRREYQIKLGDYPRIERFWVEGFNFFSDNWKREGFVSLVDDEEPKAGDLLILQTSQGSANHIAIYVGDQMIMHHCHGRLSRRDIYGGYWLKHTVLHLRHETKC